MNRKDDMATRRPEPDTLPTCPFCSYTAPSHNEQDVYMLLQHVEFSHSDQESPFMARDASPANRRRSISRRRSRSNSGRHYSELTPSPDEDVYVDCPLHCGEAVHIRELDDHMDLHEIERLGLDDLDHSPGPVYGSRYASPRPGSSRARTPSHDMDNEPNSHVHLSGGHLQPPDRLSPKHASKTSGFGTLKEIVLGPASKKNRPLDSDKKSGAVKRLGKAELGPHAFEDKMPAWLFKQLSQGPAIQVTNTIARNGSIIKIERVENETPDIIPVLANLSAQDHGVSKAFLCHPAVKHIFKTPKEGGFCGYRNIQMMISFMQGTNFPGHEHFPGRTPSIIRLQDMIENAWDKGFNATGRIETGGICGTRKYIGTPEAQALFCSLNIPCEANAFNKSRTAPTGNEVYHQVLQAALEYFSTGVTTDPTAKVYQTGLAPIYFQHPGHSLTICGLEIRKSGRMNLLCLDPMFKTGPGIAKLIGTKHPKVNHPEKLLKAYRRGDDYLKKHNSFEIMKLMAPLQDLSDAVTLPSRLGNSSLPSSSHRTSR